ncbi:mechanosensitive ion channel protein [Azospirillum brasilense]|uniref:Mechanosensitive ion channel protein n=3 Tax=Azospirillum brasilense TaxID=192 RepID=A0A0P0EEP4_AZOBR|nr:mechanosensitive ion channel protein [Azospirillum brasilense]PWC88358.1 mechanosensitive ion channel protein [Azospirillum sp. Sp 7]OPH15158.1 mechanosensitive ion channel protein [Azospirillum brasilense]OPH17904.1 mechanosensitive ion channel protein [Azospirillum brasilense]QCO08885.1 mechanosensitive ion channel protein [Azospirillum brasilense]
MLRARTRWTVPCMGALAVLLLLLAGFAAPSLAAGPVPGAATPAPAAAAPAEPAASPDPTPEQMQAMITTLEDPAARARLVEQLKALVAAQKGLEQAKAEEAPAASTLPETIGASALSFLAERMDVLSRQLVQVGNVFKELPGAIEWANRQMVDQSARDRWVQIAIQLTMILTAGLAIQRFVGWLLARPRNALAARRGTTILVQFPLLLGRALLELAPIAAFIVVGYAILSVSEPGPRVRLVALAVINATVILQILLVAARILISPFAPSLRMVRVGDANAQRLYRWVRRLAAVGVYGYFLAEGAYVLGLPLGAYGALLKLLGLAIAGMLIALILQNRRIVADWMHGNPLSGDGDPAATAERESEGQGAVLRSARRRFADVWHVLAIIYVVVTFGVWVLNVYGGFEYLARATGITILVAVIARLLVNGINRGLRRGLRMVPESQGALPPLKDRASLYLPFLHRAVKTVIWVGAAMMILYGWGFDTLAWTDTRLGQRILRSTVTIGLLLVGSVIAWEVVSAMIERFLASTDRNGTRIERSARVRTLLPLLRNAFLILLVTMVSLITLSELGVNIAPLLAGAGVVGLAVGFGSQTLVKDIITGLFILFEDSISIGDVVDVGGGHSGSVEAISIRSIRLRDGSGAIHTVPFNSVSTVKNMSKDFSYALFEVRVAYREDPDRVIELLKDIGASLQSDTQFAPDIMGPLEVMGLDKFQPDSTQLITARFKTRPTRQWGVSREFNRRMKKRFDELGVEVPTGSMQLIVGGNHPDRALAEALSQGS